MEGSDFPDREAHAREHAAFLEDMRELQRTFAGSDEQLATTAALELRNDLGAHMNDADRRLAAHVSPTRRPGAEAPPARPPAPQA